jgi:dienelactone hydrolase
MLRVVAAFLVSGVLCLVTPAAHSQSPNKYTELFYRSSGLPIQAYLYKPDGEGPFPAVIYNHGSRAGRERDSLPCEYIGAPLSRAGYAVLIPERRGYGHSGGLTWSQDVGSDKRRAVARLHEETDDVLAAVDYLRTLPFVDPKRIGIMGWSLGGIVTMFAVSRSTTFAVAVNQAGGALMWNGNPEVRRALIAAAGKATTPTLLLVAENDRTTASITTLGEILKKRGVAHRMVIYESFTPQERTFAGGAPGHRLFSEQGMNVWQGDVLEFLGRYLGGVYAPEPQR